MNQRPHLENGAGSDCASTPPHPEHRRSVCDPRSEKELRVRETSEQRLSGCTNVGACAIWVHRRVFACTRTFLRQTSFCKRKAGVPFSPALLPMQRRHGGSLRANSYDATSLERDILETAWQEENTTPQERVAAARCSVLQLWVDFSLWHQSWLLFRNTYSDGETEALGCNLPTSRRDLNLEDVRESLQGV